MPSNFDTPHVKFHNLDVVIARLKKLGGGAEKYIGEVMMRCMTEDIWPNWIQNISLQDHSLEQLAKLGHPYAVRFGVDSFVHPDSEVHRQSGSLIEGSTIQRQNVSAGVAIRIVNTSPHYIFLRYGTRYMRFRDPAGKTMADSYKAIRTRIHEEVKNAIVEYMTS